jgi:hypothetical protein
MLSWFHLAQHKTFRQPGINAIQIHYSYTHSPPLPFAMRYYGKKIFPSCVQKGICSFSERCFFYSSSTNKKRWPEGHLERILFVRKLSLISPLAPFVFAHPALLPGSRYPVCKQNPPVRPVRRRGCVLHPRPGPVGCTLSA